MVKKIIKTGIGNLIGISLVGATASAVNTIPAGTAKSIAGITPGLQSVALVAHNVKGMKSSKLFKLKGGRRK